MGRRAKPWTGWSATKLDLLFLCSLAFSFEYVLGMRNKVPQGIPKIFGGAMHYMLELLFKPDYGFKSLEKCINYWIYYWLEYTLIRKYRDRVRVKNEDDPKKYLAIGISMLKNFWYENIPYRTGELTRPEVEKSFKFIFKGHHIRGKIDRIQPVGSDEVEIWDYKTGYKKPTKQDLIRNRQLTIYNLALRKEIGKDPIRIRVDHLLSGEQFDAPIRTEKDYMQLGRWLDEARIYVQNILEPQSKEWKELPFRFLNPEDIERQHFSPRPNPFCGSCDYDQLCQEYRPKDPIRERWIKTELERRFGPDPGDIQLELPMSKPKIKRKRRKNDRIISTPTY